MTMATAALPTTPEPSPLLLESHVLGTLQVREDQCFTFPEGILGFPACKRFALLPAERTGFWWLQSLDCPSLTFLLADPFLFIEGFYVDLNEGDLLPLRATRASELGVLAIVTLPRTPLDPPTANLQGPLVLNPGKRLGRQVVLPHSPYGTRWPLELSRLRKKKR